MTNGTIEPTAARNVDFPLGAHIVTPRRWYTHHGIYVGAGQVVHYAGLSDLLPIGRASRRLVESVFRGRNGHEEEPIH